jgi:hypothetical protein
MKNIWLTLLAIAAGSLLIPVLVFGHHGLAAFDQTKVVTVKGTVTEFHFVNPHCIVEFDVKDEKGQVQKWKGELTSPIHLKGWTATSLEPGNEVNINGYRAKTGAYYIWILQLHASNGLDLKSNRAD